MSSEAERQFHLAVVRGAERLKREIGYNPTRFIQMIANYGGVQAARALLAGPEAADGFTTLWQHQRLDMSIEAFVLLPWYRQLFTDHEQETARRRLVLHNFDIDRFLRTAGGEPTTVGGR